RVCYVRSLRLRFESGVMLIVNGTIRIVGIRRIEPKRTSASIYITKPEIDITQICNAIEISNVGNRRRMVAIEAKTIIYIKCKHSSASNGGIIKRTTD